MAGGEGKFSRHRPCSNFGPCSISQFHFFFFFCFALPRKQSAVEARGKKGRLKFSGQFSTAFYETDSIEGKKAARASGSGAQIPRGNLRMAKKAPRNKEVYFRTNFQEVKASPTGFFLLLRIHNSASLQYFEGQFPEMIHKVVLIYGGTVPLCSILLELIPRPGTGNGCTIFPFPLSHVPYNGSHFPVEQKGQFVTKLLT